MNKKTKQLLQITKNAYSQALEVLGFVKQKEQMSDQKLNTELERRIRQIREGKQSKNHYERVCSANNQGNVRKRQLLDFAGSSVANCGCKVQSRITSRKN